MTLLELITSLREDILDDLGGENTDWTGSTALRTLRWSNAALTRYINEAQNEVVRRTHIIRDATQTLTIIAGTDLYEISELILDVDRARLSLESKSLLPASWKDIENLNEDWESRTGTPKYYITDWQSNTIKLYPTPVVADTLNLVVDRLPKRDMRVAQWTSDKPEIQEQWQYKMLHWAAHLAYSKDEPNTLDPQKAKDHSDLFTLAFGIAENAYGVERKKKPKRAVAYGGIEINQRSTRGSKYTDRY